MRIAFKSLVFHPFIAATFPILALVAFNIDETPISSASRALIVSIVLMGTTWIFFFGVLKELARAALMTSLALIVFYTYGHLHTLEIPFRVFGLDILSHRYLLPISLLVIAGAFWVTAWKIKDGTEITYGLNLFSLVLIIFPIYQIITFQFSLWTAQQNNNSMVDSNSQTLESESIPDIYVLILDMYPRGDYLLEEMNFDNSLFLDRLEDQGFFIADCSLSNYSFTRMSLTALLNMDYIDNLLPNVTSENTERSLVDPLIRNSLVRQSFEQLGYTFVAFQTDFPATNLDDADVYYENDREFSAITVPQLAPEAGTLEAIEISQSDNAIGRFIVNLDLNKFEWLLVQTSALRIFPDFFLRTNEKTGPNDEDYLFLLRQYSLNKFVLDALDSALNEVESPKFVFFHIVSPHPPTVFDENGFLVDPKQINTSQENRNRGFTDQIIYLNKRILSFVEETISISSENPIIIIQGDHGPSTGEPGYQENEVLAAYYFPDGGSNSLKNNISSVNVFRHIFNYYFGANYEYLEDRAYTSQWASAPFDFSLVQEEYPNCLK